MNKKYNTNNNTSIQELDHNKKKKKKWFNKANLLEDDSDDESSNSDTSEEEEKDYSEDGYSHDHNIGDGGEEEDDSDDGDGNSDDDTVYEEEGNDMIVSALTSSSSSLMKFHKIARQVRVQSDNIQSRLKSIQYDSQFISDLKRDYPTFALFANLRCGQWYFPTFDDTCYFKSTDGHYGQWDFSTTRLNLNVLINAYKCGGLFIVDSTRKGKRFPDSLTKTVPIWVTIMNRLIHKFCDSDTTVPSLEMPFWLSKNETSQIEARLDRFLNNALEKTINWREFFLERHANLFHTIVTAQQIKYMKCLWVHRGKDFDFTHLHMQAKDLNFIPIICTSASDPDFIEKSFSWRYIQGAGDDHESWSRGLTPHLFYTHMDHILEDRIMVEETERRVDEIVLNNANTISMSTPSHDSSSSQIIPIGSNNPRLHLAKSTVAIDSLTNFAVIQCKSPESISVNSSSSSGTITTDDNNTTPLLILPITDDKKYRNCLERHLAEAIAFANEHLRRGRNLLITDEQDGQLNESVAVMVGIMCALFTDDQDMSLFQLQDDDNDHNDGQKTKQQHQQQLDKTQIRQRLSFIQSYHSNVNPSRNMMKQLNRYFL